MLYRLCAGDITKRDYVLWCTPAQAAIAWLRLQSFEEEEKMRRELARMEFEAKLHGWKLRSPAHCAKGGGKNSPGASCGGRYLEECRKLFAGRLEDVCSTCPD